ncbi:uncharacterized protein LOC101847763 [Aplysia californica]|uniref:Uncharacterized protein LOC101847763 n=1 Tax=Aplysia californica TaxID=6500 RepID=A0ABM0K4H3_APLCA|nr:uncharacterized protein LOC101847763 [Aplysia californica]
MEDFPLALVIASQEEVYRDNNVLFRLVRPAPDGAGVQSTDRLVNVVPFRRVYCFERKHEIHEFRQEMLKRPLVIQPVLHFGRGLFDSCGCCYTDESWVVMINQTHPKILSRLQMGLDCAKAGIERGQSVEVKFCFGDLIQRVYKEHLAQKELGEAETGYDACLASLRYAEWEYCDVVIRHHGYAVKLGRTPGLMELKTMTQTWTFDDIGMHEMLWSQVGDQIPPRPHLSAVTEDEIRAVLPSWTINSVSPLENIGDEVPQHTYSYEQAGRLYESFRKKKRQRGQQGANADRDKPSYGRTLPQNPTEELGAVGGEPPAVEHDFGMYDGAEKMPSQSRRRYQDESSQREDYAYSEHEMYYNEPHASPHPRGSVSTQQDRYQHGASPPPPQYSTLQVDKYGHLDANVQIVNPSRPGSSGAYSPSSPLSPTAPPYNPPYSRPHGSDPAHFQQVRTYDGYLKKQDSDRSSHSTNADSGYCADADGQRSRGGSYDLNEYSVKTKLDVHGHWGNDTTPLGDISGSPSGLENAGFRYDDNDGGFTEDMVMRKHKELAQKMLQQQSGPQYRPEPAIHKSQGHHFSQNRPPHSMGSSSGQTPPRPKVKQNEQIAESFI